MKPTDIALIGFAYGALAMWTFMSTAYRHPEISRWFYALDALFAVALLSAVFIVARRMERAVAHDRS